MTTFPPEDTWQKKMIAHNKLSILSEHYGFTPALLDDETDVELKVADQAQIYALLILPPSCEPYCECTSCHKNN